MATSKCKFLILMQVMMLKSSFSAKFFPSFLILLFIMHPARASIWTSWTEYASDPVFNPGQAYYPSVLFNANQFGDTSAFYKMWYGTDGLISVTYSADGINWALPLAVNGLPIIGAHPLVLFDENGFGGSPYLYRMWLWDPNEPLTSISAIKFSQSMDGINWTSPISITQDLSSPLVTGISPGYFYHLYGPGYVIYNPAATSIPGQPFTFSYVMFFDTSTEGLEDFLKPRSDGLCVNFCYKCGKIL